MAHQHTGLGSDSAIERMGLIEERGGSTMTTKEGKRARAHRSFNAEAANVGGAMSTRKPARYTLEVEPSKRSPGTCEWTIRERGKVLQRSNRVHRSEGGARRHGEQELERVLDPRGQ